MVQVTEALEQKMLFGPRQSHVDTDTRHSTCAAVLLQRCAVFLFLFHSATFSVGKMWDIFCGHCHKKQKSRHQNTATLWDM